MTSLRDEYVTPRLLVRRIEEQFSGPFVIDLAADASNRVCEAFLSGPCTGVLTCTCSLHTSWADAIASLARVHTLRYGFLNPPYSNLTTWINKAADEQALGARVVMLGLPFNSDQWAETVFKLAAECWTLVPRVQFAAPGIPASSNQRGSMITVWDKKLRQHHGRLVHRFWDWQNAGGTRWLGGRPRWAPAVRIERVTRGRMLTTEEAGRYDEVRAQVEEEFPPRRTPMYKVGRS